MRAPCSLIFAAPFVFPVAVQFPVRGDTPAGLQESVCACVDDDSLFPADDGGNSLPASLSGTSECMITCTDTSFPSNQVQNGESKSLEELDKCIRNADRHPSSERDVRHRRQRWCQSLSLVTSCRCFADRVTVAAAVPASPCRNSVSDVWDYFCSQMAGKGKEDCILIPMSRSRCWQDALVAAHTDTHTQRYRLQPGKGVKRRKEITRNGSGKRHTSQRAARGPGPHIHKHLDARFVVCVRVSFELLMKDCVSGCMSC